MTYGAVLKITRNFSVGLLFFTVTSMS